MLCGALPSGVHISPIVIIQGKLVVASPFIPTAWWDTMDGDGSRPYICLTSGAIVAIGVIHLLSWQKWKPGACPAKCALLIDHKRYIPFGRRKFSRKWWIAPCNLKHSLINLTSG